VRLPYPRLALFCAFCLASFATAYSQDSVDQLFATPQADSETQSTDAAQLLNAFHAQGFGAIWLTGPRAYDAAVANYRQTVLSAFQDVEDQLAAQRLLALQSEKESLALNSARRTVDISMTKYKGGVITYLDVVVAQSAELNIEQTVVQLSAQRLAASVSLIKALGAGWTADTTQAAAASPGK